MRDVAAMSTDSSTDKRAECWDWYVAVAVPGPLPELMDYAGRGVPPAPGAAVRVPLGRRAVVGVVCELRPEPRHDGPLRGVLELLDGPAIPEDVLALALWAASYYQHAPGDAVLPLLPREAPPARTQQPERTWHAIAAAPPDAKRTPARARAFATLRALAEGCSERDAARHGLTRATLRELGAHGHALAQDLAVHGGAPQDGAHAGRDARPPALQDADPDALELSADQRAALRAFADAPAGFAAFVLEGVTGSGKTEVYLRLIDDCVRAGGQALVLVPEIALTPQTVQRFAARFPRTAASHSGLTPAQRNALWHRAERGEVDVIVGTRSAVFSPLRRLGVIVIDEEHDTSFKQQEGFRYSARDLAVKRARDLGIPVVLGSATPALETLLNVQRGRYRGLQLRTRPGGASLPRLRVQDIRGERLDEGMGAPLLRAIRGRLEAGEQALLFLNRRGYAPTLLCAGCGWVAECPSCDARMTAHLTPRRLVCHHCDHQAPWPALCPSCGRPEPQHQGLGTQRIELALQRHFPDTEIVRVDRDIAGSAKRLQAQFDRIRRGEPAILVGTQMLAKGHHFPAVTLSAVINADGGLLSADFRAPERTAQLIVQVAGRAGRTGVNGELWLQTYQPDHPVIRALQSGGYPAFARLALAEREAAQLPPHAAMAILRADGIDAARVEAALQALRAAARDYPRVRDGTVTVSGPVPAPLPRRAQRYRFQLALLAADRGPLHAAVAALRALAERVDRKHVRIGIDIDPIDLY